MTNYSAGHLLQYLKERPLTNGRTGDVIAHQLVLPGGVAGPHDQASEGAVKTFASYLRFVAEAGSARELGSIVDFDVMQDNGTLTLIARSPGGHEAALSTR